MADVVYRFRAVGADSVAKAYESIGKARRSQQQAERDYTTSARQATRRTTVDPLVKAEQEKTKALEKEKKRQERVDKDHSRALQQIERERENAAKAAAKRQEKVDKDHSRALEQGQKQRAQTLRKYEREQMHAFQQRRSANMRGVLQSNARIESLAGGVGRGIYGGLAGAGGAIAMGAIGLTGGAARSAMQLEDISRNLATQGRAKGGAFVDPSQLSREFMNTAVANPGQKAADIAQAASMYVGKTGDLDSARKFSGLFATTASASGGQVQDIAAMAASIAEKFGIKTESGMKDALASVYFQGKSGAFELKDAAGLYDKLTAAGARFGLDQGVGGVRTLGGLTQIARGSTGSSEQAAFAVEASLRQLIAKSSNIKDVTGVDVFTDASRTKARDVTTVMKDVIAGAGGDQTKLQKIFGDEGIRGVSGLITAFNQAQIAAGKNATEAEKSAAGMAAMDDVFNRAIGSGTSFAEVQKDASFQQQSSSARWIAVWETITATIGPKVLPPLEALAARASELTPVFEYLAGAAGMALETFLDLVSKFGTPEQKADAAIVRKEKELNAVDAAINKRVANGEIVTAEDVQSQKADKLAGELTELKVRRQQITPEGLANMSDEKFRAEVSSRDISAGSRAGQAALALAPLLNPGALIAAPLAQASAAYVGTAQTSAQREAISGRALGAGKEVDVDPTSLIQAMKEMVSAFSSASASLEKSKQGSLLGG